MHLARQGLPPDLAKNLAKEIVEGSDFTQSEWYPQIFNLFEGTLKILLHISELHGSTAGRQAKVQEATQ